MLELIETLDGSSTVFHRGLQETYHSKNGAMAESEHVFIKNGFDFVLKSELKILEVGFGTGLNALLSATQALEKQVKCIYVGLEPFLIGWDLLSRSSFCEMPYFKALHEQNTEKAVGINPYFDFILLNKTLESMEFNPQSFDLIYFDAFASQQEIWSKANLEKCHRFLKNGGVFVTFSAKGQLKRDLKSLGFYVENPKGAPGKKEMTRATKPL